MVMIDKYQYNGLIFKIDTGFKPVVVGTDVAMVKKSIPILTWTVSFKNINLAIKNKIEDTIFNNPNDLYINTQITPAFVIAKRLDIYGVAEYYLTYKFEHAYYNTFVNKPLNYTDDGVNHNIEGGIVIPKDQDETMEPIVLKDNYSLLKKVIFNKDSLKITHTASNIFDMTFTLLELASPLNYSNLFTVGESYENYDNSC